MERNWKRICCPVDFSTTSEGALRVAAAMAREPGTTLTLLHVRQIPGSSIPEGVLGPPAGPDAGELGPADRPLVEWKASAEQLGASRVEVATSVGDPAQEIVDFARRGRFDAIVIGTHGRSGLMHAVLGSVAEHVVRAAPCLVLSVTPEAARASEATRGRSTSPSKRLE